MSRLIVVSNRVTLPDQKAEAGGLAVALQEALKKKGGIWFGWSGNISDSIEPRWQCRDEIDYVTVDFTQGDYDAHYVGFCNQALWPLFHYRMELAHLDHGMFEGYQRVNLLFADHLANIIKPKDVVWVHDYQLLSVGHYLRQLKCSQKIGFFLHIPFPVPEVLMVLPDHQRIVQDLSAYDLVGFQTPADLQAFIQYIVKVAGGRVVTTDKEGIVHLYAFGKKFKAGSFPISIDVEEMEAAAKRAIQGATSERMKNSLEGRALMIGADRLDYTKGLVHRLQAFEYLLSRYPQHLNKVSYTQIAPTSRGDVKDYREIRKQLEALAGHINGLYAEVDWVPYSYINKSFSRKTLAGFYRMAKVGLVTPLRDGMNLVAKEYVASQDPEDPGVLVLSQFAGAAHELKEALIVNPFDIEAMGEALHQALIMPLKERKARYDAMMLTLKNNNIFHWSSHFLAQLQGDKRSTSNMNGVTFEPFAPSKIVANYPYLNASSS